MAEKRGYDVYWVSWFIYDCEKFRRSRARIFTDRDNDYFGWYDILAIPSVFKK